jgi:hypothetical protein
MKKKSSTAKAPVGLPPARTSIVRPTEYLTFSDLGEPEQKSAKWIADFYVREDRWPTQVEFARFCFDADLHLDDFRNDQDVFESSISATTPSKDQPARVRPWVFFDLSLCSDAFTVAHECFVAAIKRLAKGPATTEILGDEVIPAGVPAAIRRLVGHLIVERCGGGSPDENGNWSAPVEMYHVKQPLPDLYNFIRRPERRHTSRLSVSPFGLGGQRPTLWAFVSSTFRDLKKHRQAALEAALKLKVLPLGMELWTAGPTPPLRYCLDELAEADLMILIGGRRYGSVVGRRSYTEAEYDHARKLGIPIYVFLPSRPGRIRYEHARRLEVFVARLERENKVAYYDSVDDLRTKLVHALSNAKAALQGGRKI